MVINIQIKEADKVPETKYSMFLAFEYNSRAIEQVRSFPNKWWHADVKQWELPLKELGKLTEKLNWCEFDITGPYIEMETRVAKPIDGFQFKTKPFQHQIEGFEYGLENDRWLLADEQGLGKALSLDSKIYTPNGYKLMKNIKVGDTVFGRDGKPTKVIATYFHDNVEMYKITFSDGAEIKCCKDHLWKIHKGGKSKIVDTQWFLGADQFGRRRAKHLKELQYYIDRCEPVQFNHREVPLDGYIIGALLGDGGITNGVGFTTADSDMVAEINKLLPEGYLLHSSPSMHDICYHIVNSSEKRVTSVSTIYFADGKRIGTLEDVFNWLTSQHKLNTDNKSSIYSYLYPKALQRNNFRYGYHWSIEQPETRTANKVKRALQELDLFGKNSHNKFIPDLYKYNSADVRLAVVQGLIDTDGYVAECNLVQYTTVSKQLAEDMRWMIESLGGLATISTSECGYNGKITGHSFTLTIRFDTPQDLCRLPRKKNKLKERKFKPRRKIVGIEKIDNAPAKCIAVDNEEHLYLTDHFVVTHNTKQVIDIAVAKKMQYDYKHCLIVCGVNGLKWNWLNEIHTHSDEEGHILGQRYTRGKLTIGGNKDKLTDLETLPNAYFLITNVESLRDKAIQNKVEQLCKDGTIGVVAIDEIHKCKDPSSQQGKGILKLVSEVRIAMTGTPVMNNPMDCYIIMKWLGHETHSYYAFRNHYCDMGGFGGYQIIGYRNMKELQGRLDEIMLRRRKDDVLDLPEKTYVTEYVEMSKNQKRIYDEVTSEIRMNIDQIAISPNPLAQLIRMRQATGYTGILSSEIQESAKLDRMEELVQEAVEAGKQVVIFSNWTLITDAAYDRLFRNYKVNCITGDTADADRQNIVETFQDGGYDVLIGSIGAMGTGLTLTAGTVEIFLDEPWNKALKDQAEDRCHRVGTTQNVTIYTLICKDTIDERINEIVEQKGMMADALIDGNVNMDKLDLLNFLVN